MIKYFVGPMSKNVVDCVLEHNSENKNKIGFIPSRRQVSYNGGYVNNWTTESFSKYVNNSHITRDHAGPGQGYKDDDGYQSLKYDCKHFTQIHIDPWKKYSNFDDGCKWTVDMINFCFDLNPEVLFEVATEESIRKFDHEEVGNLLHYLKKNLHPLRFKNIKHCVIQSGTSLKENKNTGIYDQVRLKKMIDVVKQFGILTKEHNGDYLPSSLIQQKFSLGLDCINIAPEFGQIETRIYLNTILTNLPELLNTYWQICYDSKRWVKWVSADFDPTTRKEELINICGHYVLSSDDFLSNVKSQLPEIDNLVKSAIAKKILELYNGH